MPHTPPTVCDLQTDFPAFADVDDAVITRWLGRAAAVVDESWTETDFAFARELLACHLMALNGIGAKTAGDKIPAGAVSFKSGSFSASFSEQVVAANARGDYSSTIYGRQFLPILHRNKAGPRTTGGCAPYPVGYGMGYPAL